MWAAQSLVDISLFFPPKIMLTVTKYHPVSTPVSSSLLLCADREFLYSWLVLCHRSFLYLEQGFVSILTILDSRLENNTSTRFCHVEGNFWNILLTGSTGVTYRCIHKFSCVRLWNLEDTKPHCICIPHFISDTLKFSKKHPF